MQLNELLLPLLKRRDEVVEDGRVPLLNGSHQLLSFHLDLLVQYSTLLLVVLDVFCLHSQTDLTTRGYFFLSYSLCWWISPLTLSMSKNTSPMFGGYGMFVCYRWWMQMHVRQRGNWHSSNVRNTVLAWQKLVIVSVGWKAHGTVRYLFDIIWIIFIRPILSLPLRRCLARSRLEGSSGLAHQILQHLSPTRSSLMGRSGRITAVGSSCRSQYILRHIVCSVLLIGLLFRLSASLASLGFSDCRWHSMRWCLIPCRRC